MCVTMMEPKESHSNVLNFPIQEDAVPFLIYSSRNAQRFWRVFIVDAVNDLMVPITKGTHKTDSAAQEEARMFMENYLALPPGSPLVGCGPAEPMPAIIANLGEKSADLKQ